MRGEGPVGGVIESSCGWGLSVCWASAEAGDTAKMGTGSSCSLPSSHTASAPAMSIRCLFQPSALHWAWRTAALKSILGRQQGVLRWTHSGGHSYRAVIFDMGGVLIPSPGTVAAGELSTLSLWGLVWGKGRVGGQTGPGFQF